MKILYKNGLKLLIITIVTLISLYGMGILSILVHKKGRENNGVIKDYGIQLMDKIDTSKDYVLNEFLDYHMDEVMVISITIYAFLTNLFFNEKKKMKFMFDWFILLGILLFIKGFGMIITIVPPPQSEICDINYKHNTDLLDVLLGGLEVYIYRDRVCYDIFMNSDMINTTILCLLIFRDFNKMIMKIKVFVILFLHIFVLMMLRSVYSVNMYITVLLSMLIFIVYNNFLEHYKFGIEKLEEVEIKMDYNVNNIINNNKQENNNIELDILDNIG